MELIKKYNELADKWNYVVTNQSDPRVADLLMMSSPLPSAYICMGYIIFVFVGPAIMKNKKPFDLKSVIIIYNLCTFLISGYLFYEFLMSGWLFDYTLGCEPVDYSYSPKPLRMTRACWLFFLTKFTDLLDTVFFILRKKNNQLTFLHVFHHAVMPVSSWFALKFIAGGLGTFGCLLNSFIHFLMYFYYFLSAFGDRFKKFLFWKKYLTSLQMLQFIAIIIHSSQLFFTECNYSKGFIVWLCSYMVIFLIFFGNYYRHEYFIRQKKNESAKKSN